MAEELWLSYDGRSALTQFAPPPAGELWLSYDGRSALTQFAPPPAGWANWDWLNSLGMGMAADSGGVIVAQVFSRMLMGIGI